MPNTIPVDRLKEVLQLNEATGKLYWRSKIANKVVVGKEAGGMKHLGDYGRPYWVLKVDGVFFRRGRLVYAMTRGVWPTHQIDHVNRDGLDDRPDNLRDVTCKENNANRKWPNRKGEAVYHKSVA